MGTFEIPELLAPAGGLSQLKAAVQNGADAVYMGGPLFNARIRAENFDLKDIEEAICYAHDRNVRIYITINTLIKDKELKRAFEYVNFLYGAGADAIIVQDMGLARLVRKYLPDFEMHLSTQGTVYNRWAVETVKKLGFSRIVPAREMSLEEIESFVNECHGSEPPCQVEVFVHGALCMCYSGQCHMSRVLGGGSGRSGNRGLCAQPCRLPYSDEKGEKRFLLSPKDLCTVDMIPQLCRAGVDSLKIEGRLKSPQYVAVVTSVYRKYLDMYRATGAVDVTEEDKRRLMQIFNRGGFGHGYLENNPGAGILSGDSPKNKGIYIGKVFSAKKGSSLIDIKPDEDSNQGGSISMGDGVEIRGETVAGNVITYIKRMGDGILRIGDIKSKVKVGDKVYKVTDRKLTTEAERSYSSDFIKKLDVEMRFTARCGKAPILDIYEHFDRRNCESSICDILRHQETNADKSRLETERTGAFAQIRGDSVAEKALKKPVAPERIKAQLSKLGDTVFRAASVVVDIDNDIAIPIAEINKMRRQAVGALMKERRCRYAKRVSLPAEELSRIVGKEGLGRAGIIESYAKEICGLLIYSRETAEAICKAEVRTESGISCIYIPLELYMDAHLRKKLEQKAADTGARLIPYILDITKGSGDRYICDNFQQISETVRDSGILLGNLGWVSRFREAGVKIYGGSGLNVYNSQCMRAYNEIGIEVREYSREADAYYSGDAPLMITEHPVTAQRFRDRKGVWYKVMQWHSGDKYLIFREAVSSRETDKKVMMQHLI